MTSQSSKKKILAISSDQRELLTINDTLKKEGFEVLRAINGPSALELAVTEVPHLIIIVDEVHIIEPFRLTEILKSNPVIETVPFIFVGFKDRKPKLSPHDRILEKPLKPSELLNSVRSIFRIEEKVPSGEEITKKGTLKEGEIADFLMFLSNSGADGTLILTRGSEKGYIYFDRGNIINATIDKIEGEKALHRIVGWRGCDYEFIPVRALTPVRIKRPSSVVLIDAVRYLEEFEVFKDRLPLGELTVHPAADISSLPPHASPLVKEILLLTEIYRKVEDIVNACSYPDIQVLKALASLAKKGLVRLRRPSRKKKIEEPIVFPSYLQSLKEKIMGGRGEVSTRVQARLLFFSGSKESIQRLKEICGGHPSIKFYGDLKNLEFFSPLGKVRVGENISIDMLLLKSDETYLPLYSLFRFKTLGAVFILSDFKGERKVADTFREYITARLAIPFRICVVGRKPPSPQEKIPFNEKVNFITDFTAFRDLLNDIIGETPPVR